MFMSSLFDDGDDFGVRGRPWPLPPGGQQPTGGGASPARLGAERRGGLYLILNMIWLRAEYDRIDATMV